MQKMQSFFLPPGNLDLVTVTGPDAVKLLQGQLTCDVEALADPGFTHGALCNNKGRVLATFILVRQGLALYLVLNKGLGEVLASALKKYLPFYKCELRQVATDAASCFGASGDSAVIALGVATSLPQAGQCASVTDGWICNLDQAQQQYLVFSSQAPAVADVPTGTVADWLACGLHSGQFPFVREDTEKYTAQELSLDRHDYVSFTKGCYTGQEIVARMHYRGKHKKSLFLLTAPAAGYTPSGEAMEFVDPSGQLLGTAMKLLPHQEVLYALATLPADMENTSPANVKNRAGLQFDLRLF